MTLSNPAPRSATLALLLLAVAAPAALAATWQGPEGPLPFDSAEELVEYLETADVVGKKQLTSGSTKPWRLDLERDGIRGRAIFRTIDKDLGRDFRKVEDHFRNEVAAWEVARLLGLDIVPPAGLRKVDGEEGSVQLWLEDVRSETDRIEADISHGDRMLVELQKQRMRIFDALISNFDRNTGNMLFDRRGRLWLVDHTRSFKPEGELPEKLDLTRCERRLWHALRALELKDLKKATRPYLDMFQTVAMLERLELLRQGIAASIETLGEDVVLYDLPDGY